MNSLMGKILYVDLSARTLEARETPREFVELYAGQKGLGARLLMEDFSPATDAFAPENKVVLSTSIMAGTIVCCSAKLAMTTRSPLTGTITDGSVGGHLGAELKYAGYDAVVISGRAESLCYLYIDPDKAEIRDAAVLKGLGSFAAEARIKELVADDEVKIMTIGPGGENRVPFACVSSERYRQLGRGGIGAVWGSKNLKAVAVRGWLDVKVPDMARCLQVAAELQEADAITAPDYETYEFGTPVLVDLSDESGLLPTRNFQEGRFAEHKRINGESLKALRKNKKACFACGIACGNYVQSGEHAVEGPEYETIALLGSSIGNGDPGLLIALNAACDDAGLDTISTGGVLAYMMEMTEKKLHDFGIRFGETAKALALIPEIAFRRGVGAEAALGSRALAAKYGGEDFAIQVKGQELPGYDPRGSWGMGLAYATAPRGGCHMSCYPIADEAWGDLDPFTFDGKARYVVDAQNTQFAKFSMGICDFWALSAESLAKLFEVTYGGSWTAEQVNRMGERIFNLQRIFNCMAGFDRRQDTLPGRFFRELLQAGPPAGIAMTREAFEGALSEYYALRGWDEQGRPTPARLEELGIEPAFIAAYRKTVGF
jgi:aldehyde:ferredoxin oxidoreductase